MEIGVGPVWYRDLNSDLLVCITQDFLLIQTVTGDAHGILLYMENDYFCFSMHSSSLYSIFANWLYEHPRIHKYYTSFV